MIIREVSGCEVFANEGCIDGALRRTFQCKDALKPTTMLDGIMIMGIAARKNRDSETDEV